jgi:hypothetical protein
MKLKDILPDYPLLNIEVRTNDPDGKGYAEYAMFTPEEANAILKYCGLNTEN